MGVAPSKEAPEKSGIFAGIIRCLLKCIGQEVGLKNSTSLRLERQEDEWNLYQDGTLMATSERGEDEEWSRLEHGQDMNWQDSLSWLHTDARLEVASVKVFPAGGFVQQHQSSAERGHDEGNDSGGEDSCEQATVLVAVRVHLLPSLLQDPGAEASTRKAAFRWRAEQIKCLVDLVGLSPGSLNNRNAVSHVPAMASTSTGARDEAEGDAADLDDDDDDGAGLTEPACTLRDHIFDIIAPTDWTAQHPEPPGLVSTLMPFQKRCLAWLLHREKAAVAASYAPSDASSSAGAAEGVPLHPCYSEIKLPSGDRLYTNSLTGDISLHPIPPDPDNLSGGILSDEMGLGKTVEMIALILANKPPQGRAAEQECVSSLGNKVTKPSAGTLVIAPSAIVKQWVHELEVHAPSLKVVVYEGLYWNKYDAEEKKRTSRRLSKKERMEQAQHVWAEQQKASERVKTPVEDEYDASEEAKKLIKQLRQADVVITTFPVLQREHHYPPLEERMRVLRQAKRYTVPESPLISMGWHRVVIDEAQRVRLGASQVASMARRLTVEHRWCVTGTPIGPGGLKDIHGLLAVLQHGLLKEQYVWDYVTGEVHGRGSFLAGDPAAERRMRTLLRPIMWRNSKVLVGDELYLPERTLLEEHIKFTPHEREFYNSVLSDMRANRDQYSGGSPGKNKRLEPSREGLLQLRLCCLHPQLTSKWKRASNEGQLTGGVALSMAEIMQTMAGKAAGDVQAAERDLCMVMNTLVVALLKQAESQPAEQTLATAAGPSKRKRKRAGDDDAEGSTIAKSPKKKPRSSDPPKPPNVLQQEAQTILEESRAVSEGGIGALSGQAADNLPMAVASWNAWRPLQISISHALAQMYDNAGLAEQAAALRADAAVKAAEVLEAPKQALEEARQRLTAVEAKMVPLADSLVRSWDEVAHAAASMRAPAGLSKWAALALRTAGVPEGGSAEWVQQMEAQVLAAQEEDKGSRIQHASAAGDQEVLMGTAVKKLLQLAEAPLLELRITVEAGYLVPEVQQCISRLHHIIKCLSAKGGSSAMPAELHSIGPESVLLGGALSDSAAASAMQLASSLAEAAAVNIGAQQNAVRKLQHQLEKQLSSLTPNASKVQGLSTAHLHGDLSKEVQVAAWDGVRQQLSYIRHLSERATVELQVEKAEGDLGIQQDSLDRVAQKLMSDANDKERTTKQLQSAADKLKARCKELHHHALYLEGRQQEAGGEDRLEEVPVHAVLQQSDLPDSIATSSMTATGIQAATSLASLIGLWDSQVAWHPPVHGDLDTPAKAVEQCEGAAAEEADAAPATVSRQPAGSMEGHANTARMDATDSLPECPVCLQQITGILQIWPCAHITCEACTNQIFADAAAQHLKSVPCPVCRTRCSRGQIFRSAPASIVPAAASMDEAKFMEMRVVGSWMTKVEALLRRLLYLRQTQPDAKSLVFSQWTDALKLASRALSVQKPPLEFVMLESGARAWKGTTVDRFNRDQGPSVFLLPLNAGASGLTLTRANHVFLLEPSVDPALLQQAIARVHRYGQSRDVFITYLLVHGTVEEEVHRICKSKQALLGRSNASQGADAHEDVQPQDVEILVDAILGE